VTAINEIHDDFDVHVADVIKHITAAERTKWNAAQLKKLTEATGYSIDKTNADMNTLKDTGLYYGSGMTNGPAGLGSGWTFIHAVNANFVTQEFTVNTASQSGMRKFWRVFYNGTWLNWNEIETTTGAQAKVDAHSNDAARHVTATDKAKWDAGQLFKLTQNNGLVNEINGSQLDLNNYSETGFFYTQSSVQNIPLSGYAGYLEVLKVAPGYSTQRFTVSLTSALKIYERFIINNVWTNWILVTDNRTIASTLLGNKFVDQSNANFVGKVSGSTVANPHIFGRASSTTLTTPGVYAEQIQLSYDQVSKLDATTTSYTLSTNGQISQMLFSFNLISHIQSTYGTIPGATTADKVAWLKSNLSKLTFNWWGFGASPAGNKASVKIWAPGNSTYDPINSNTASTPQKISLPLTAAFNIGYYIGADGFIHFLAHADASDGVTPSVINTDYVELQVELSTDIKSNLNIATTADKITITDAANYYAAAHVEGALAEIGQTLAGTRTSIVTTAQQLGVM